MSALATLNFCGYDEDYESSVDAHLLTRGPLYHAAPLPFSVAVPLVYGVPLVVMDHWDPVEALRLIEQHGITHTHMVPTMFHRLLVLPAETRQRFDTSSLRFVIHGAAPCPVPVKQRLIEWLGPVVVEYYAATEGLGPSSTPRPGWPTPAPSAGPWPRAGQGGRRGRQQPPAGRGRTRLPAGAGRHEVRLLRRQGEDDRGLPGRLLHAGRHGLHGRRGFLYLTDRTANLIISAA